MIEKVLVVELNSNTYIGMTQSGEFIERELVPGLAVGDYINIKKEDQKDKGSIIYHPLFRLAAVFILVLSLVMLNFDQTSLVLTIDINPSIEISLNENEQIIKAIGLNEHGKELLKMNNLKGSNIDEAVSFIVEESIIRGYIKPDIENLILISRIVKLN
jgi:hypothetical protein